MSYGKSTLKTINKSRGKANKAFPLFFIHVIVNKSSDEFVRNEMKSMKNKRTVPFYQYIISLLCVAFLAGGSSYIYFDHRVKR